jgi:hypothetical protein
MTIFIEASTFTDNHFGYRHQFQSNQWSDLSTQGSNKVGSTNLRPFMPFKQAANFSKECFASGVYSTQK